MIGGSPKQETEAHEEEWETLRVLAIFMNKTQEKITKENMVVVKVIFHWQMYEN